MITKVTFPVSTQTPDGITTDVRVIYGGDPFGFLPIIYDIESDLFPVFADPDYTPFAPEFTSVESEGGFARLKDIDLSVIAANPDYMDLFNRNGQIKVLNGDYLGTWRIKKKIPIYGNTYDLVIDTAFTVDDASAIEMVFVNGVIGYNVVITNRDKTIKGTATPEGGEDINYTTIDVRPAISSALTFNKNEYPYNASGFSAGDNVYFAFQTPAFYCLFYEQYTAHDEFGNPYQKVIEVSTATNTDWRNTDLDWSFGGIVYDGRPLPTRNVGQTTLDFLIYESGYDIIEVEATANEKNYYTELVTPNISLDQSAQKLSDFSYAYPYFQGWPCIINYGIFPNYGLWDEISEKIILQNDRLAPDGVLAISGDDVFEQYTLDSQNGYGFAFAKLPVNYPPSLFDLVAYYAGSFVPFASNLCRLEVMPDELTACPINGTQPFFVQWLNHTGGIDGWLFWADYETELNKDNERYQIYTYDGRDFQYSSVFDQPATLTAGAVKTLRTITARAYNVPERYLDGIFGLIKSQAVWRVLGFDTETNAIDKALTIQKLEVAPGGFTFASALNKTKNVEIKFNLLRYEDSQLFN